MQIGQELFNSIIDSLPGFLAIGLLVLLLPVDFINGYILNNTILQYIELATRLEGILVFTLFIFIGHITSKLFHLLYLELPESIFKPISQFYIGLPTTKNHYWEEYVSPREIKSAKEKSDEISKSDKIYSRDVETLYNKRIREGNKTIIRIDKNIDNFTIAWFVFFIGFIYSFIVNFNQISNAYQNFSRSVFIHEAVPILLIFLVILLIYLTKFNPFSGQTIMINLTTLLFILFTLSVFEAPSFESIMFIEYHIGEHGVWYTLSLFLFSLITYRQRVRYIAKLKVEAIRQTAYSN